MWIPCLPGARPSTWALTWTTPLASSTSPTQPTSLPLASTNVPWACWAPPAATPPAITTSARTAHVARIARLTDIGAPPSPDDTSSVDISWRDIYAAAMALSRRDVPMTFPAYGRAMYDQRIAEPTPAPETGDPWRPEGVPFPDGSPDTAADRYVAVDRLDEEIATLIVAPWPVIDPETGRLAFLHETEHDSDVVDVETLTARH